MSVPESRIHFGVVHYIVWALLHRVLYAFVLLLGLFYFSHIPAILFIIYGLLSIQINNKTHLFCVVKERETIRTRHFLMFQTHSSMWLWNSNELWKPIPFSRWASAVLVYQCFLLLCIVLQFHFHPTNLPPLNAFWESYLNSQPFSQFNCAGKSKHISQLSEVILEPRTNRIRKGSRRVRAGRTWSTVDTHKAVPESPLFLYTSHGVFLSLCSYSNIGLKN